MLLYTGGNVDAAQSLKLEVIRHIDEVLYVEVNGILRTKLPGKPE